MITSINTKQEVRLQLQTLLSKFEGPHSRKPNFEHYGRTIVCRLQSDLEEANDICPFGVAVCHDNDRFDIDTGKLIALMRAMGAEFDAKGFGNPR